MDAGVVEVRHGGEVVAAHRLGVPGAGPVWDPTHRAAAEAIALAPQRHLRVLAPPAMSTSPAIWRYFHSRRYEPETDEDDSAESRPFFPSGRSVGTAGQS